ncbi:hypothetical protein [Luteitalea sp.]|uniref:hypothetical protein n=1 Tax=Luteitalea sp. TaxID=2004800 RepID=UPI0025C2E5F3|nr:hypothetical protein [Luteitalea sp.]
MEFELLQMPRQSLPWLMELKTLIEACERHNQDPRSDHQINNGPDFFSTAAALLLRRDLPVLRIRDTGTSGLFGDDSDTSSPWYRLIRKQGAAQMHGAGGGTFGIGQRAPFAASGLRTVFYSSKSRTGEAFIGKSILASFDWQGQIRQPVGYWGVPTNGDRHVRALKDAEIPPAFRRSEQGLDLYVTGCDEASVPWPVLDEALVNCFASVLAGVLEVSLKWPGKGVLITKSNILTVLKARVEQFPANRAADRKRLENAYHYALALVDDSDKRRVFTYQSPQLGELKLYVRRDPSAPNRTVHMRRPRTVVFEKGRNVIAGYAAVLLCDNPKGNKLLARLEDPTHTKWMRERQGGQEILGEVTDFVRRVLEELASSGGDEPEDIPDLGDYLPDEDDPGTSSGSGANAPPSSVESSTIAPPQGEIRGVRSRRQVRPQVLEPSGDTGAGTGAEGLQGAGTQGGEASGRAHRGDRPGDGEGPHGGDLDGAPRLDARSVRGRTFWDGATQEVVVVLTAQESGTASVRLLPVGEDPVREAAFRISSVVPSVDFSGIELRDVALEAGSSRSLRLKVVPARRVALRIELV